MIGDNKLLVIFVYIKLELHQVYLIFDDLRNRSGQNFLYFKLSLKGYMPFKKINTNNAIIKLLLTLIQLFL